MGTLPHLKCDTSRLLSIVAFGFRHFISLEANLQTIEPHTLDQPLVEAVPGPLQHLEQTKMLHCTPSGIHVKVPQAVQPIEYHHVAGFWQLLQLDPSQQDVPSAQPWSRRAAAPEG